MSTHNIESFVYSPAQLAEEKTGTVHDTLHYLFRHDFLSEEEYEDLVNTLVVCPINNKPRFGRKILDRLFGRNNDNERSWVFPITSIDPEYSADANRPIYDSSNVITGNFSK